MRKGYGINSTDPAHWRQGCDLVRLWDSGTRIDLISPVRGRYNWSRLDYYVAQAQKTKTLLVFCLGATPQWMIGPQVPPYHGAFSQWSNYLPDLTLLAEFVAALVEHCQRPDGTNGLYAVEAWNEWNAGNFLDSKATPQQVADLGKTVYQAVKAVNPNVLVTTPTPCWSNGYPEVHMEAILAAGVGQYCDVVTFHGYLPTGADPSAIAPHITAIRNSMQNHGVGEKLLWETESGWGANSTVPDADKPAYIQKWLAVRDQNGCDAAFWYQWDNTTHGTLFTSAGGVNPAGQAYMAYQSPAPTPAPPPPAPPPVPPPPAPKPPPTPEPKPPVAKPPARGKLPAVTNLRAIASPAARPPQER